MDSLFGRWQDVIPNRSGQIRLDSRSRRSQEPEHLRVPDLVRELAHYIFSWSLSMSNNRELTISSEVCVQSLSTAALGSESELCLALPVEFCKKEKEGIPSWRNGKHKIVGKERVKGYGYIANGAVLWYQQIWVQWRKERKVAKQIVEGPEFQVQELKIRKQWEAMEHVPSLKYKSSESLLLKDTRKYMKSGK